MRAALLAAAISVLALAVFLAPILALPATPASPGSGPVAAHDAGG